jgi:hypothetical protein
MVTFDRGAAFSLEVRGPETTLLVNRYQLTVTRYKLLIQRMYEKKVYTYLTNNV